MNYEIIPIAETHIQGFWNAVDYVARERKYLAFLEAPPIESTEKFIKTNLENDNSQFVVLAEDKLVGWCDITPMTNRPVHKHTGVLGIGLLPSFRGRGIGSKLIEKTINKAQANGLTRIELTVREDNKTAIELYKKFGFKIEGLKKNAELIDGQYNNIYMMALVEQL